LFILERNGLSKNDLESGLFYQLDTMFFASSEKENKECDKVWKKMSGHFSFVHTISLMLPLQTQAQLKSGLPGQKKFYNPNSAINFLKRSNPQKWKKANKVQIFFKNSLNNILKVRILYNKLQALLRFKRGF
jgi:hypothetical protein